MIKVILWDIDGTLLDFKAAEYQGIRNCFQKFHLGECTDEMIVRYSQINDTYWERLELGTITKKELFTARFAEFFQSEGIDFCDYEEFNREYQAQLADIIIFRDNGYELVKELKGSVKQYAVTNGSFYVQSRKLEKSGLKEVFDDCFISDRMGIDKPNKAFFDYVKKQLNRTDFADGKPIENHEILIVGDSLTSDMKGGNNAGILCCWYNPNGNINTKDVHIDYEIRNLQEVKALIL